MLNKKKYIIIRSDKEGDFNLNIESDFYIRNKRVFKDKKFYSRKIDVEIMKKYGFKEDEILVIYVEVDNEGDNTYLLIKLFEEISREYEIKKIYFYDDLKRAIDVAL